jgi:hypothetical protein
MSSVYICFDDVLVDKFLCLNTFETQIVNIITYPINNPPSDHKKLINKKFVIHDITPELKTDDTFYLVTKTLGEETPSIIGVYHDILKASSELGPYIWDKNKLTIFVTMYECKITDKGVKWKEMKKVRRSVVFNTHKN